MQRAFNGYGHSHSLEIAMTVQDAAQLRRRAPDRPADRRGAGRGARGTLGKRGGEATAQQTKLGVCRPSWGAADQAHAGKPGPGDEEPPRDRRVF